MLFLFRSAPEVEKRIHSKLFRNFLEEPGYKRAGLHYCNHKPEDCVGVCQNIGTNNGKHDELTIILTESFSTFTQWLVTCRLKTDWVTSLQLKMKKWVLLFLLFDDVYGIAVILQHFPYSLNYTPAVKDLLSCCRLKGAVCVVKEASLSRRLSSAVSRHQSLGLVPPGRESQWREVDQRSKTVRSQIFHPSFFLRSQPSGLA